MADETRNDSDGQHPERPRRTTLTGRRFGYVSFPAEEIVETTTRRAEPERPRRDTAERRRAS